MADSPLYILRPYGRTSQNGTLEGAFRVHIPVKEMRLLGLETGDLCELKTQANKLGLAFAFPLADQQSNDHKRVVKITDMVKDVFNLTYQDRVTISKGSEELRHADRVLIADVTQQAPPLAADEIEEMEYWAMAALGIYSSIPSPQTMLT
jgi:AAA family ATPase